MEEEHGQIFIESVPVGPAIKDDVGRKENTVEFRLKGSICKLRIPAENGLRHHTDEFGLEYDETSPFSVWVPRAHADKFWKIVHDELVSTPWKNLGRSRLYRCGSMEKEQGAGHALHLGPGLRFGRGRGRDEEGHQAERRAAQESEDAERQEQAEKEQGADEHPQEQAQKEQEQQHAEHEQKVGRCKKCLSEDGYAPEDEDAAKKEICETCQADTMQ